MTFVVSERVKGTWIVRGTTPSYPEAQALAKSIKAHRLARGEQPELVERSLEIRNHFSEKISASDITVGDVDKARPRPTPKRPIPKTPLVYLGSLAVLILFKTMIAEHDEKVAGIAFNIGLAAWIVIPIYLFFRGMTFREVVDVFKFIICGIVVVFVLGTIMPASCSKTSGGFDWARKP